jgi:iron complex transport system substrate-binding protein
MTRLAWLGLFAMISGTACRQSSIEPRRPWPPVSPVAPLQENLTAGCVANFDSTVDYFPHKAKVRYATQFEVSYHGHYKRLRFRPNVAREAEEEYLLVQCGTPVPPHDPKVRVVVVPARRFVLTNLAFLSAAVRMGLAESLIGVSSINSVSHPEVIDRHRRGLVSEVGTGPHSSVETAIATQTDLLFTFYSAWPNYNTHPKLWEVGIQGLPTADHFELSTLGRSEWIKFLALFFNREQQAESIFEPAALRYEQFAKVSQNPANRPEVLVGWPSGRDIWNLNGAHNYFASLIWDAGGRYFWTDDSALSLVQANLERVFDDQRQSRFYISRSYSAPTRKALAAKNPVMPHLKAFSSDQIWSPDHNTKVHRRPPWQDQSLDYPDVVLKDMIAVLHPELLPDYEPYYLRKLD